MGANILSLLENPKQFEPLYTVVTRKWRKSTTNANPIYATGTIAKNYKLMKLTCSG
jgi:hypothetical protein